MFKKITKETVKNLILAMLLLAGSMFLLKGIVQPDIVLIPIGCVCWIMFYILSL